MGRWAPALRGSQPVDAEEPVCRRARGYQRGEIRDVWVGAGIGGCRGLE